MQIRKATMNDLPDILAIYAYARKYMKEHGNPDQWRDSYPPVSLTTQDIQSDCLYVCIIQIEEDEQIGHKRKRRGAHAGCARCHSAQVQARRHRFRRLCARRGRQARRHQPDEHLRRDDGQELCRN